LRFFTRSFSGGWKNYWNKNNAMKISTKRRYSNFSETFIETNFCVVFTFYVIAYFVDTSKRGNRYECHFVPLLCVGEYCCYCFSFYHVGDVVRSYCICTDEKGAAEVLLDRKSTRLNSSHVS